MQSFDKIESKEVDLKEFITVMLNNKIKLVAIIILFMSFSIVYIFTKPNVYKSEVILLSQIDQKNVSGGLSSLANLAGLNFSNDNSKKPETILKATLSDYLFHVYLIEKYNLTDKINNQKNLIFPFNFDKIYKTFGKNKDNQSYSEYQTVNKLKNFITIEKDKNNGLLILSAELNDRELAQQLVDIYLKELIHKIKSNDMKEIDKQIEYYNRVLSKTYDVSLKEQLSKSLSALYQKKVFSQSNDYYFVSKVVDSRISNIEEKISPKRSVILMFSFLFSIIFAILLIFIFDNFKKNKE